MSLGRIGPGPYLLMLAVVGASWTGGGHTEQPATPEVADAENAVSIRIGDFYIDRYEYPNRLGSLPRVSVSWATAGSLCRERGKRLCTEAEWERAARGSQDYLYGYGPDFEPRRCNTPFRGQDGTWRRSGTSASGTYPRCASDYGVVDMIGNVWEWTDGWYDESEGWRIVRGGSWFNSVNLARTDTRYGRHLTEGYALDLIGFRCCRSAGKTTPVD